MARLYAKDIVVNIPDGEYFAMSMSERNEIACQIEHFLTAAVMEIRGRLRLADVHLENN